MYLWFAFVSQRMDKPIALGKGIDNEEKPCSPLGPLDDLPAQCLLSEKQRKRNVDDTVFLARTGSELTNTPAEIYFSVHELSARHSMKMLHFPSHLHTMSPHTDMRLAHPSRRR